MGSQQLKHGMKGCPRGISLPVGFSTNTYTTSVLELEEQRRPKLRGRRRTRRARRTKTSMVGRRRSSHGGGGRNVTAPPGNSRWSSWVGAEHGGSPETRGRREELGTRAPSRSPTGGRRTTARWRRSPALGEAAEQGRRIGRGSHGEEDGEAGSSGAGGVGLRRPGSRPRERELRARPAAEKEATGGEGRRAAPAAHRARAGGRRDRAVARPVHVACGVAAVPVRECVGCVWPGCVRALLG